MSQKKHFQISAFYQFVSISDPKALKKDLDSHLAKTEILGTIIVAYEGLNGTISAKSTELESFFRYLSQKIKLHKIHYKIAYSDFQPFHRMKVRLKKEIVTLGIDGIDPLEEVGTYIAPQNWNQLIKRDDVVLIDTRNDYEFAVGTFKGAINPKTQTFREFPNYIDKNFDPQKTPKVAMFCTGGIRCEKATAMMLQKGFKEVYHLKGGILEYFNQIPTDQSTWEGECFVFDNRVTVNQELKKGSYEMCHACRNPITEEDKQSKYFEEGVSCPHCHSKITKEKKERLLQRNKQIHLAKKRDKKHLGYIHPRHQSPDNKI